MNLLLNYLLEANMGLLLFMAAYYLLVRQETDFRLKRASLLVGVVCSLAFPLLHWNLEASRMPVLNDVMPMHWLPGVTVGGDDTTDVTHEALGVWDYIGLIYGVGILIALVLFVYRLMYLLVFIRSYPAYHYKGFTIAESTLSIPSFSFFRYIFIGQADTLSAYEKEQVIKHEMVHASRWHSLDILLMNIVGIFFWFNPVLISYRKIFIQLHEFEADARAVENRNVDDYCSLLARVALMSADIKLANHFNQSLTLKRIEMMRTIKMKTRLWKIAAMVAIIPSFLFVVACQDQVAVEDMKAVAKGSSVALDIPADVQTRLDELQTQSPGVRFEVIEINTEDGKAALAKIDVNQVSSMHVIKRTDSSRQFVIVEINSTTIRAAESLVGDDKVFTVVEDMATPEGGLENYMKFISREIRYPQEARDKDIEGNVFVSFIVETDGKLSDIKALKPVHPLLDAEAIRVVTASPTWTAGKQSGTPVRVRMVVPIKFRLSGGQPTTETSRNEATPTGPNVNPETVVVGYKQN